MSFQVINLNDTSPEAPANSINAKWQKGATSGIDPATGLPIYPVSVNLLAATSSVLGVTKPDGTVITVATDGTTTVPKATTSSLGVVEVDGTTIQIDPTTGKISTAAPIGVFGITIDGGSSPPATGVKGFVTVPYDCTITGWTIICDQVGSAGMEIDFHAGSAPPVAPPVPNTTTDKISASAPISLSAAQTASGDATAISTWTKTLTKWGTLGFNLTLATTVQRIHIQLQVLKT